MPIKKHKKHVNLTFDLDSEQASRGHQVQWYMFIHLRVVQYHAHKKCQKTHVTLTCDSATHDLEIQSCSRGSHCICSCKIS